MKMSLMDVHSTLSSLVFAVDQALEPFPVEVKAEWENHRYLSVEIRCYGKHVRPIADRLAHGVLQGEYDYRFSVSQPTNPEPDGWVWVRAYPDLSHDDRRFKAANPSPQTNLVAELEWVKTGFWHPQGLIIRISQTPFGAYKIIQGKKDEHKVLFGEVPFSEVMKTIKDATSWAQDDYVRRITSALASPSPQSRARGSD